MILFSTELSAQCPTIIEGNPTNTANSDPTDFSTGWYLEDFNEAGAPVLIAGCDPLVFCVYVHVKEGFSDGFELELKSKGGFSSGFQFLVPVNLGGFQLNNSTDPQIPDRSRL